MTAENANTHRFYMINVVVESREIATYGETLPNYMVQKDVNNSRGKLSRRVIAHEV